MGQKALCGVCWQTATWRGAYQDDTDRYGYCDRHAERMRVAYGDRVALTRIAPRVGNLVLVSGQADVLTELGELIAVTCIARSLRLNRAMAPTYGSPSWARSGWRIKVWHTPASGEAWRRAAISDL